MLRPRMKMGRRLLMSLVAVPILGAAFAMAGSLIGNSLAGANYVGDNNCNYSWANPNEYLSIGCETGVVQYVDTATLTVPTAYSYSTNPYVGAYLSSFSGPYCGYDVFGGSQWNYGYYVQEYGWNNSAGFNAYFPAGTSPGSQYEVWLEYIGNNTYYVYENGYAVDVGGLGSGSCYGTAGLDINTEGVGLNLVAVDNTTWA